MIESVKVYFKNGHSIEFTDVSTYNAVGDEVVIYQKDNESDATVKFWKKNIAGYKVIRKP